jgi:hypothetical protein
MKILLITLTLIVSTFPAIAASSDCRLVSNNYYRCERNDGTPGIRSNVMAGLIADRINTDPEKQKGRDVGLSAGSVTGK